MQNEWMNEGKKTQLYRKRESNVYCWNETEHIVWMFCWFRFIDEWTFWDRWWNGCNNKLNWRYLKTQSYAFRLETACSLNFITTSFLIISRTRCSFLPPKWFYGSWNRRIFSRRAIEKERGREREQKQHL